MAFVYRPVVIRKLADGRKVRRRSRYYWANYIDPTDGHERRAALLLPSGERVSDGEVARQTLRAMMSHLQRKAAGLTDPAIESAGLPIRTGVARFARHLRGLRRTPKHVRLTIVRLKWLCDKGGMVRLADVNESNACKALRALNAENRAPKTINDHRAAMYGLCQWAVKVERLIGRNPLEAVPKTDVNGDVRKVRRALTPDEAAALLSAAGPRRTAYSVAMLTGLRWGELKALRWGDLDLDGDHPAIVLRAITTKARRADSVPLRADLADTLRAMRPPFARGDDPVFRSMPKYETFIRDCVRAGIVELDEHGRQIPDERGRTVDRHGLRTTFCTWLSKSGVSPRTAQVLARHTDVRLTMRNYTDPALLDARAGVESLPDLSDAKATAVAQATGTDNLRADGVVLPVVLHRGERREIDLNASDIYCREQYDTSIQDNNLRNNSRQSLTGGGGNRTRVPEHFGNGLYVHSR